MKKLSDLLKYNKEIEKKNQGAIMNRSNPVKPVSVATQKLVENANTPRPNDILMDVVKPQRVQTPFAPKVTMPRDYTQMGEVENFIDTDKGREIAESMKEKYKYFDDVDDYIGRTSYIRGYYDKAISFYHNLAQEQQDRAFEYAQGRDFYNDPEAKKEYNGMAFQRDRYLNEKEKIKSQNDEVYSSVADYLSDTYTASQLADYYDHYQRIKPDDKRMLETIKKAETDWYLKAEQREYQKDFETSKSNSEEVQTIIEKGRQAYVPDTHIMGTSVTPEFAEIVQKGQDINDPQGENFRNYLFGKYDYKTADKMYQKYLRDKGNESLKEASKNNKVIKNVFMPAYNLGTQMLTPIYGAETIAQQIKNMKTGKSEPVSMYSPGSAIMEAKDTSLEAFTEGDSAGKAFFKNVLLSLGGNVANIALTGGAAPLMMGLQSGSSTAYETAQKGGTNTQALVNGILGGTIEYLTEKLPFDELAKTFKGTAKGFNGMSKADVTKFVFNKIGLQAISEYGEETVNSYASTIADMIVMGDKSEYALYVNELMENGNSKEKAYELANKKFFLSDPQMAGLSGLISGGLMSSGAITIGTIKAASDGKGQVVTYTSNDKVSKDALGKLHNFAKASGKNIFVEDIAPVNIKENGNEKYLIKHTTENSPVVIVEEDILKDKPKVEWVKMTKEAIKRFKPAISVGGRLVKVNRITTNEYTNSKYTQTLKKGDTVTYKDKLTASGNLDEIVLASRNFVNEDLNHKREDSIKEFARGNVLMQIGNNKYKADVIIAYTKTNNMLLYDITDMQNADFDIKNTGNALDSVTDNPVRIRKALPDDDNISQNDNIVNNEYMQESGPVYREVQGYTDADGDIHINSKYAENTEDVLVAYHEVTHTLENSDAYDAYRDIALKIMYGGRGTDAYNHAMSEKSVQYGNKAEGNDLLERELVAEFTRTQLSNKGIVERIAAENKNVATRILTALKKAYTNIKNKIQGKDTDKDLTDIERAINLFEKALSESRKMSFTEAVIRGNTYTGPYVDDEGNVRFENGELGRKQYFLEGVTKEGIKKYKSDFPESMPQKERVELFKKRIATIFNLGMVELKTDTKKIVVKGDKFTAQKNLYGDIKSRDFEKEARVNALYDLADILSDAKFKSAEIEESYKEKAVPPKNAAHKDVKYWYKFENAIYLDGVKYNVVFNIRDKGKEQYEYLIEFYNNKKRVELTSNTANGLLRDVNSSPNNNIPQPEVTVKNNNMQKSGKDTKGNNGEQYLLGGESSVIADNKTLAEARRMNLKGEPQSEIFKKTGWYKGLDKKWKKVIDEKDAGLFKTDDKQYMLGHEIKIEKADVDAVQNIGTNKGRISVNDFDSNDIKATEKFARKYYAELKEKSPFFRAWFGDWRENDKTPVTVATKKDATRGTTINKDTGWNIQVSGQVFNETKVHQATKNRNAVKYLDYINSVIENAVLFDSYTIDEPKSHNSAMMHSLYAFVNDGNGEELIKLYVEELNDVNKNGTINRAYQLQDIIKIPAASVRVQNNLSSLTNTASTSYTVADLFNFVKQNDSEFNPKPSSLLLDEEGKPLVVYHGTNAKFDVFDMSKGRANMDIQGSFFSPWKLDAQGYGENVGAYYLSIKNPADGPTAYAALNKFKGQSNAGVKAKAYLIKQGYDGVNFYDEEYVAFYPTQIKSATDNIGTFDKNNPKYRYLLGEVVSNETDTKVPEYNSTAKSRDILTKYENDAVRNIAKAMSVSLGTAREYLKPVIQEMSTEYMKTGKLSKETTDRLFEEAYKNGRVINDEAYKEYADLRKYLRDTKIYIDKEFAGDIPDFFKEIRRYMGRLNVSSSNGTPVDSIYEELSEMHPDMFPDDIYSPSDRMLRIMEVSDDLRKTETTLDTYYNTDELKGDLKYEFENAVNDFRNRLYEVKHFNDAIERAEVKPGAVIDAKSMQGVYDQLKAYQKEADKVMDKLLLTKDEKAVLEDMLSGKRSADNDAIPDKFNKSNVMKAYNALLPVRGMQNIIENHQKNVRNNRDAAAMKMIENSDFWKDKKSGLAYMRETQERNVYDIVKNKEQADKIVETYFTPVHEHEAERTRFKHNYFDKVRDMDISRRVTKGNRNSESEAVQFLGEVQGEIEHLEQKLSKYNKGKVSDNANSSKSWIEKDREKLEEFKRKKDDFVCANPNLDYGKIDEAIGEFRKIYNELFEMMNEVRIRNGYAPVEYRKNYFPHFMETGTDSLTGKIASALGINVDVTELPTDIAGRTENFKPGIAWVQYTKRRNTNETKYDAIEGFQKYIEGVSDVIFHTDDIQNLRAFERAIRYKHSEKGVKDAIDELRDRTGITDEEREELIGQAFERNITAFSNYVNNLTEYTNLLANKKSMYDRGMEKALNRKFYNLFNWVNNRVASNMIVGNLSTAITNFIPLTQATAVVGSGNMLIGFNQTVKNTLYDDGMTERSTFLTNRFGQDKLISKSKVADKLSWAMEFVDEITSGTIWRARYHQNIKKGMSDADAIKDADRYAANLIADRSKGALPTVFGIKNPLVKAFTAFQVETNNQLSHLFKDIPEEAGKKLALVLFKYFLGAYLFNDVYEKVVGRRPALDPISWTNEFVGDLTGKEMPNSVDIVKRWVKGEKWQWENVKTEEDWKERVAEALWGLGTNVVEEIPFAGGLIGGGRLPISSAVVDEKDMKKLLSFPGGKKAEEIAKDNFLLNGAANIILPYGASQLRKTVEGAEAYLKGGSYRVNNEGEEELQYPVDKGFWSATQSLAFGKSSTKGAQDWVEDGFGSLTSEQTELYKKIIEDKDTKRTDVFNAIKSARSAESIDEGDKSKTAKQSRHEILKGVKGLSDNQKGMIEYSFLDDGDKGKVDSLRNAKIEDKKIFELMYNLTDHDEVSRETKADKYYEISKSGTKDVETYWNYEPDLTIIQRETLVEDKSLTQEQKQLINDTFIKKNKTEYDYSNGIEGFYYSALTENQKKGYNRYIADRGKDAMDARSFYYAIKVMNSEKDGRGSKELIKKQRLREIGFSYAGSNRLYRYATMK